jgi:protein SCO1/2
MRKIVMKKRVLLFVLICLFALVISAIVSGCQKTAAPPQNNSSLNASANAKRYPFKGKVVSVNKEKKEATISHEAVPEISMDAMTMPFPIKDTWVMDELSPGSQITAELVVDKGEYYLEHVGIIALPNPDQPPPPPTDKAGGTLEGAEVPDLKLTNQDGKRISLKDFRGKALAVTFIYTRCPLPNYCPLMMLHFSEMAMNIQQSAEFKDKIRLLSISFDPKNDTPPVLKKFAAGYYNKDTKPDFNIWQLATGSEDDVKKVAAFFGLYYQSDPADEKVIDHSLRTFVIDPQGKVKKVFPGNEWTTDQVLSELRNSLAAEGK